MLSFIEPDGFKDHTEISKFTFKFKLWFNSISKRSEETPKEISFILFSFLLHAICHEKNICNVRKKSQHVARDEYWSICIRCWLWFCGISKISATHDKIRKWMQFHYKLCDPSNVQSAPNPSFPIQFPFSKILSKSTWQKVQTFVHCTKKRRFSWIFASTFSI